MTAKAQDWAALPGAQDLRAAFSQAGWREVVTESTVKEYTTVMLDGYGEHPGTTVRGNWTWPTDDPSAVRTSGMAPLPGTRSLAPTTDIDTVAASVTGFPPPPPDADKPA
ncbi:hypothetical protein Lfu02_79130 [Longispora fulva]|uniref:Uncharacterized protein n=1 Tax=Longispora fulva TaxID=619741 RepID=A0A8J7G9N5_9ACTN|nr:hypothetical protein [Longispora fulva]MBG6136338.1 hypothetical protein [Longispora fulva]GIG63541.1 hypothetical protein Lfu02_79130 [Longispora fulva]